LIWIYGLFIRKRIYKYIGNIDIDNNKEKGKKCSMKLSYNVPMYINLKSYDDNDSALLPVGIGGHRIRYCRK
jgi:hypothetical protein